MVHVKPIDGEQAFPKAMFTVVQIAAAAEEAELLQRLASLVAES